MTAALETALSDCDDLGVCLRLADDSDRIIFRVGEAGFPDPVRDRLKAHRPELVALLRSAPRPDPDPVWFVGKNLDVDAWPLWLVPSVPAVWRSQRPFYRVTPRVWVWCLLAVEQRLSGAPGTLVTPDPAHAAAAARVEQLGRWVAAHYRPDQIARAMQRRLDLPQIQTPPAA